MYASETWDRRWKGQGKSTFPENNYFTKSAIFSFSKVFQPGPWISPSVYPPSFLSNVMWSQFDCIAQHCRSPNCLLYIQHFIFLKHSIYFSFLLFIPLIRHLQQFQCLSIKSSWEKHIPYVFISVVFWAVFRLHWPSLIILPFGIATTFIILSLERASRQCAQLGILMHCLGSPPKICVTDFRMTPIIQARTKIYTV